MENENKTNWSLIISIIGPFLILLGVFRLIYYYKDFNINILFFLEFSEIITSIFDILVIVVLTSFILPFLFILKSRNDSSDDYKEIDDKLDNSTNFLQRLPAYIKLIKGPIKFYLAIIAFMLVLLIFIKEFTLTHFLILTGFSFLGFVIIILYFELDIHFEQRKTDPSIATYARVLTLMAYLFLIVFAQVQSDIHEVRAVKRYKGVTLKLDNDSLFISDRNDYFIGKINKYVFIHHENENYTDVVPIERVKELKFPPKRMAIPW